VMIRAQESARHAKNAKAVRKKRLRKSKSRRHLALQMPLSRAEIARRWRAAHPETVEAQKRRYYHRHKARLIESRRCYKRLWRARNRQRLRAQAFERRQKLTAEQKARKAAYMLKWRSEHGQHIREYATARHARLRDLHYRQQRARLKRASESSALRCGNISGNGCANGARSMQVDTGQEGAAIERTIVIRNWPGVGRWRGFPKTNSKPKKVTSGGRKAS
jgi:hypothetical protein